MKKEDLYNELGNIDPKFIDEADEPVRSSAQWKRWTAIAAAFIILAGAVGMSDTVQAAIKGLFTFIPGVSIEEQDGNSTKPYAGILYSMDGKPVTRSNGKITVTLQNVYVDAYNVDVIYKVTLDFLNEENMTYAMPAKELNKLMEENGDAYDSEIRLPKDADSMQLVLDENGVSDYIKINDGGDNRGIFYQVESAVSIANESFTPEYYGGGSRTEIQYTAHIDYIPEIIKEYGADLPITLTIGGLSFDIKLKPIETYDTVDEIGPTVLKNNISLTAVPRWEGDTLYIKMYSLNYSEFSQIYGFTQYNYEDSDILPYLTIGGQTVTAQYDGGDGTEFYFDLSEYSFSDEEKAEATYHVPVVEVLDQEETTIDFTVHDDGTIDFPDKVSLKYADIEIKNMAKGTDIMPDLDGSQGWEVSIGIDFTVVPKQDNITFESAAFTTVNGKHTGGGSCTEYGGNEWKVVFQRDNLKKLTDYHSVTITSPIYVISDEYVFSLN